MKMVDSMFVPTLSQNPSIKSPSSILKNLSLLSSLLFISITLMSAPCFAENAAPPTSVPNESPTAQINVKDVISSKGISAWLVEAHEIPVVSVAIAFRMAGTIAEPKGSAGLTQFLAGLLDEGSGDLDSQEFKKFLLKHNIELAIKAEQDIFLISFRTIKKNAHAAFHMLNSILTKPRFDESSQIRVKNQLLAILQQSLHNEHTLGSQALNSVMFGDHPYGRTVPQILKDLPNITSTHLRQFMKERMGRDQLLISVVGDISIGELKDYLDQTFGDLPEKARTLDIKPPVMPTKGSTTVIPLNIPQSLVRFAQPGPFRKDPDWYAAFLLLKILGDGQYESRLWDEIREKRGLAYEIEANLSWAAQAGLILGGTATKNKNVNEVIKLVRKVWNGTMEGVNQNELDFVKRRLIGSFPLNFSSTLKIARALLVYQIDELGIDYINKRNAILNAITLNDVNRVAKRILNADQLSFVICGEPKALSAQGLTQDKQQGANEP
jgi:zinc protease